MWKKIALALGAILVILVAVIAMQPSAFTVERSAAIEAPAEIVFGHIQNLRAMDAWMPWAKIDPQMKTLYEGPEAGVGARSSWEGPEMGKGRIRITAVKPDHEVEMKLEMLAPMQATNRVLFSLGSTAEGTDVTWRMEGSNGFVGKAFSLFTDMDAMVGGEFAKGLASLKALAEAEAARRKAESLRPTAHEDTPSR